MKNFKFIILVIMMLSFFSCDNIYYGKKEPESDINGKKKIQILQLQILPKPRYWKIKKLLS